MSAPRITDAPERYDPGTFRNILRDITRRLELLSGGITNLTEATKVYRGTVTLNGATPVDVALTVVTANSQVSLTFKTLGGTRGAFPIITPTAGVGFSVAGDAGDLSIYNYEVRV